MTVLTTGKVLLIQLPYPYGKSQVYLGTSLIHVAYICKKLGYNVEIMDLNIQTLEDVKKKIPKADWVGTSIIGVPYIPVAIRLARIVTRYDKQLLIGGQCIEHLRREEFHALFKNTSAIQITSTEDLAEALDIFISAFPRDAHVSLETGLHLLPEELLDAYLRHEMTLPIGQGCAYKCKFCAARKQQEETFVAIDIFRDYLEYLAMSARKRGIKTLNFYATSLDFFQNPETVAVYLREIETVSRLSGVTIRVRCLSCMLSFLRAAKKIRNFGDVLKHAGIWSIGFGVDGVDPTVWKAQDKRQNKITQVTSCLELCTFYKIRAEILLVMGFPEDTLESLTNMIETARQLVKRYPAIVLRPYLAKSFIPGNTGWHTEKSRIAQILARPKLFYNLDFCAIGTPLTHPDMLHRYLSNAAYLYLCARYGMTGQCVTSPLLPQGEKGLYGKFARMFNQIMPFDL